MFRRDVVLVRKKLDALSGPMDWIRTYTRTFYLINSTPLMVVGNVDSMQIKCVISMFK